MPSSNPTTQASASEQGLFQCGSCRRKYKRLDHLARHVRSRKAFPGLTAFLVLYSSSTGLVGAGPEAKAPTSRHAG